MENIFYANSLQFEILLPLVKWRILDLASLLELGEIPGSYWTLQKIIRRFEKGKIIKTYRDPWNGKKYVYLDTFGHKLIGKEMGEIANETLMHDSKASEVVRAMLKRPCFRKAMLEHDLRRQQMRHVPDAVVEGEKNGAAFKMALELELTRKSFDRLKAKARFYIESSDYDYALYLFCHSGLRDHYRDYLEETFGTKWRSSIFLFSNTTILSRQLDLSEGVGFYEGKEVRFDEVF